MNKVEDILMGYTNAFADVVDLDEKVVKTDINKAVGDIEKILNKPGFGKCFNFMKEKTKLTLKRTEIGIKAQIDLCFNCN